MSIKEVFSPAWQKFYARKNDNEISPAVHGWVERLVMMF